MLDREKLIELIDQKQFYGIDINQPRKRELLLLDNDELADHLIANIASLFPDNIIIPPITDEQMQELKDKLAGTDKITIFPDCEPSVEIVPRWIPVTERLPQEDEPAGALCEQVQVLLSDGFVTTGWCNRGSKMWFYLPHGETRFVGNDYEKSPVVAWQPLAQPPQEVEE